MAGTKAEIPDLVELNYEQAPKNSNGAADVAESILKTDSILVGIPAYNEEVSIGSIILAVKEFTSDIVVIDDGSSDQTKKIAKQAGANVVSHTENRGKGAALQSLFKYAKLADWDAVVLLDGDGQHFPEDIPTVAKPVLNGEADIVVGSRYIDGASRGETPRYRRVGQKMLDFVTLGVSGVEVTDSQSGFRALSPKAIEKLSLRANGYGVESEMLNAAAETDLKVTEERISVRYDDVDGQTYNPVVHGISVMNSMREIVRDRRPLFYFGVPGIALFVAGLLYGIHGMLLYQSTGVFTPTIAVVSQLLVVVGVLSVFCALLSNQMNRIFSERLTNDDR